MSPALQAQRSVVWLKCLWRRFSKITLTQLIKYSFLAVIIIKDAILMEIKDCVLQDDDNQFREVNPNSHSFWKDIHVKLGCLVVVHWIVGEWLTYPSRHDVILSIELHSRSINFVPFTDISKKLPPIRPNYKWHTHQNVRNKIKNTSRILGTIFGKKSNKIYFVDCTDRYTKFPTFKYFEKEFQQ